MEFRYETTIDAFKKKKKMKKRQIEGSKGWIPCEGREAGDHTREEEVRK